MVLKESCTVDMEWIDGVINRVSSNIGKEMWSLMKMRPKIFRVRQFKQESKKGLQDMTDFQYRINSTTGSRMLPLTVEQRLASFMDENIEVLMQNGSTVPKSKQGKKEPLNRNRVVRLNKESARKYKL
jgi:hypothetical protein